MNVSSLHNFAFCWFFLLNQSHPIWAEDESNRPAILTNIERVLGPLPDSSRKVSLDVKVVTEEKLDGYVRKKISFAVEKGDRVPAWLLLDPLVSPNG